MSNDGWGNIPSGWGEAKPVSGWDIGKDGKTTVVTGEVKDDKLNITGAYESQSFSIEWNDKTWNVQAIVVGELAVICGQEPYSIIHVHTKSRFDNAIPHGEWTVEELIRWCERVQAPDEAKDNFNWLNAVDKADDWSNDENIRARGRILDWCRSVKVK